MNGRFLSLEESLWHCPVCSASALDIHKSVWWLEEGGTQSKPIRDDDLQLRPDLVVDVTDTRLKLELDSEKFKLLMRSALVEDATNASERLGALLADIYVHEDNYVSIAFDEGRWPDCKEPVSALAAAAFLQINVEQEFCLGICPLHGLVGESALRVPASTQN